MLDMQYGAVFVNVEDGYVFLWNCFLFLSWRLRLEKHIREKARKASLKKKTLAKLMEKFPQMKVSAPWNFMLKF